MTVKTFYKAHDLQIVAIRGSPCVRQETCFFNMQGDVQHLVDERQRGWQTSSWPGCRASAWILLSKLSLLYTSVQVFLSASPQSLQSPSPVPIPHDLSCYHMKTLVHDRVFKAPETSRLSTTGRRGWHWESWEISFSLRNLRHPRHSSSRDLEFLSLTGRPACCPPVRGRVEANAIEQQLAA